MAVNPRNFLFNSDYEIDKTVFLKQDSILASTPPTYYQIPHGLPFTPLPKAVWSPASDWSTTYNIGDGIPHSNPNVSPFIFYAADLSADSTYIYLVLMNLGAPQVAYLNIWAYAPAGAIPDVAFTSSSADDFAFSTDYNYPKVHMAGITAASNVSGSTEVITHGLGYYPQTEVWYARNGKTYYLSSMQTLGGLPDTDGAIVTTNNLTCYRSNYLSGASEYFHYKIYVDEA